jgi:hypothetical protein
MRAPCVLPARLQSRSTLSRKTLIQKDLADSAGCARGNDRAGDGLEEA